MHETQLLLGDEAVAMGAIDAGIGGAFSYAGTPATEIFEAIQTFAPEISAQWSANEKVAYEEALGMSYAGKRALISMKHVGLNVAADPFMSSALTGVNGGVVLVVADDPGMHSSQNEQDSRYYADFAKLPCLEPSNQQECYAMTVEAFRMSERLGVPVILRLVMRIAHSRSNVERNHFTDPRPEAPLPLPDPNDWTLVPVNARRRYKRLLEMQSEFVRASENSPYNALELKGRKGIVMSGTGVNYVHEALGDDHTFSILRIGQYPLPPGLMQQLFDHCDEVLFIEEGDPFIERHVRGVLGVPGKVVRGKLDGLLPRQGELRPEIVSDVLHTGGRPEYLADDLVPGRPPQFCKGCPHANSFQALVDATAQFPHALLFSDIGCYALGIMPPYRAVHSCVDMGASIGMAHGAARAGAFPVLCTIGDSTFAHSGLSSLLGAVHANANMTVIILDNATTAMTGAQESLASGESLMEMLRGLGVKDLHLFEPLPKSHGESVEIIRKAVEYPGLSVIVARRACVRIKVSKTATPLPVAQERAE